MKKTNENWVGNISCHIISIIILMNAFQIIIAWDFGFIFNMWIEYAIIAILIIINRFRLVNSKNIIVTIIAVLIFAINILLNNNDILKLHLNQFALFALPLLLIFLINIDLKKFIKIFYVYNIINAILYSLLIVINPNQLFQDYMTFGFNAIFSVIYVMIYAYYNKHKKTMICSIIALPIIFIYGNRGTIIIAATAIITMILMNMKDLKKKIILIFIIAIVAFNINNIAKFVLSFAIQDLGINSYSINNLYLMLDSSDTGIAIGGRYNIYKEAIEEINKNTLLGMGIAGFTEKYGYYPHNLFLDVYSTFGIIIGSVYIIYIVWIGVKLYNISNKNDEVKILFIFMIANLMKLMLSKTFIFDITIWLYISLGNYIITKYKKEINDDKIGLE